MKKYILIFSAAFMLLSCSKSGEASVSVVGSWELMSVETKSAVIGSTTITIFITFNADGTFSMEQTIGEGRSASFSGTYSLSGGKLTGVYSDGTAWGDAYTVSIDGDTMKLTTSSGTETDTYKRKS